MAFGWWVTAQPPFSAAAAFGVVAAGVTVIALAQSRRVHRREPQASPRTERRWVWLVLAVAVCAFELVMYFSHPRGEYPTISSIADPLQADHLVRWLCFGGWLALGSSLVRSK
jgi:hypothetical protein